MSSDWHVYDEGQIVLQFDFAAVLGGIPAAGLRHRYLWADAVDQLLADEALGDGETLWAMTDHLGSVRDVVDDNGTLRKQTQYDTFGRITDEEYLDTSGDPIAAAHAEAIVQLFNFTGRPLDEFSGKQNNLGRWYDADTGRWLREDPGDFAMGDANLYRYVGNAVTMYIDPAGLAPGIAGWYVSQAVMAQTAGEEEGGFWAGVSEWWSHFWGYATDGAAEAAKVPISPGTTVGGLQAGGGAQ